MEEKLKIKRWKALEEHAESLRWRMPQDENERADNIESKYKAFSSHIYLDLSYQHISDQTIEHLLALANTCQLREKINALFRGDCVNYSENQPALHTALRHQTNESILVSREDVVPQIKAVREKMLDIAEQIRSKRWLGFSGKPIKDVVNIGIGGSDLGPRFCINSLADYVTDELNYHFISDADPTRFSEITEKLQAETTLFIISSKSFSTRETLYNAKKALNWIGLNEGYQNHFIAVTAHIEKAHQFGITHVLPIWDWIGGRYSFCSAINLIAAIAIGSEQFKQLLAGANSMDNHFQESSFESNLPVLLALLGIWNNNFLHINNLLVLTYAKSLEYFVPYLQQLDMESNGKSTDNQGKTVNYATGPMVWGGSGNQAQHSYYQLLCQGTHKVTIDFISLVEFDGEIINDLCNAHIKLLSGGVHASENPNDFIPGNIPLNHIRLDHYSPFTIGALVALYEHKIYTQSVIWDINPFDQPGVESAKRNHKHSGSYAYS